MSKTIEKRFERCEDAFKMGGKFISTIPVFLDKEKTVERAVLDKNGKIKHLLPPFYHGNPLSDEGALAFTDFGWDIIDELLKAGFRDAFAVVYFSTQKALFGDDALPIIIEAVK